MTRAWSRGRITGHRNVSICFGIQGPSPFARRGPFPEHGQPHMRSPLQSSCTKIPLSAGEAWEDENHSRKRHFRPRFATVRLPGFARTDQVLGEDGITLVYSLGNLHRNAFDNDTGAVTYFQSATSSFRASATMVVLRRRPPLRLTRWWNQTLRAERG